MNIIHTKVFCSKEDKEMLEVLISKDSQYFSVKEELNRDSVSVEASIVCHDMALLYGLPEIKGLYGISQDGGFVCLEEKESGNSGVH